MTDTNVDMETKTEIKDENNTEIKPENNTEIKEESKQPEGESISGLVKAEIVNQLIEMGFSKNVSEKACFLNQSDLSKSIEWIYENQNEPDFEEELRMVGQKEQVKLSEEEIKQRAKEMQDMARKRYLQKQKELEDEQERNRVRQSIILYNS